MWSCVRLLCISFAIMSVVLRADAAPAHFYTLAPHATLPSGSQCSTWVKSMPTRETVPANATFNVVVPTSSWLVAMHANPIYGGNTAWKNDFARVNGAFSGSTDMIIRWAACKWGIDEDILRAEAVEESSWVQSAKGDSDTVCHSRNVAVGALNYWKEPSPCKPSKGLLQIKVVYFNAWPYAAKSTSLNVDFVAGEHRSCMNGDQEYLVGSQSNAFGSYPPTTTSNAVWGCLGRWYSGDWGSQGAVDYVNRVKAVLAAKGWPK